MFQMKKFGSVIFCSVVLCSTLAQAKLKVWHGSWVDLADEERATLTADASAPVAVLVHGSRAYQGDAERELYGMKMMLPTVIFDNDAALQTMDTLAANIAGMNTYGHVLAFSYNVETKPEESARTMAAELKTLAAARKIDVLAHSYGSIVTRLAIEKEGLNVDHVMLIAAPLHGYKVVQDILNTAPLIRRISRIATDVALGLVHNSPVFTSLNDGVEIPHKMNYFVLQGLYEGPIDGNDLSTILLRLNIISAPCDGIVPFFDTERVNSALACKATVTGATAKAHHDELLSSAVFNSHIRPVLAGWQTIAPAVVVAQESQTQAKTEL